MKASGKTTCNTVRVKKHGLMDPYMRDNTFQVKNMALAMRESGSRIRFGVSVLTPGLTAGSIRESG
jgi:hypothetical protein